MPRNAGVLPRFQVASHRRQVPRITRATSDTGVDVAVRALDQDRTVDPGLALIRGTVQDRATNTAAQGVGTKRRKRRGKIVRGRRTSTGDGVVARRESGGAFSLAKRLVKSDHSGT